jgi:hypothetical protein
MVSGLGETVRIGVIVAMFVLGGLIGCTSAAEQAATKFAPEKVKYEPNVGKEYWVTGLTVRFCKEPSTDGYECYALPVKTHLKIDDVVEGYVKAGPTIYYDNTAFYRIVLDGGLVGYSDALAVGLGVTETDPAVAAAECKRRGEPRLGMNVKQLEATCWGKPDHVNRRQTAKGIRDQFIYNGNRYVDLHNGIVTSIDVSAVRNQGAR